MFSKKLFVVMLFGAFSLMSVSYSYSQVNYNDVGVIVNQNDSVSVAIGNYFMQKRNIPSVNKILIDVPAIEEISDSVFEVMRSQIENYITTNNLDSKLNYLVTTKGCPLKVLRVVNDTNNCNSSVESELMMILGSYSGNIGSCITPYELNYDQFTGNPYYEATINFSRSLYDIFLVTRLDGYTIQDVFGIIDHGGPNRFVNKNSSLFVFDQDPAWAGNPLNTGMATVGSVLTGRGWQVLLDTDSVFVTHQSNVLGYQSWGSNDAYSVDYTTNAKPYNTWLAGSLAETMVSTSGRSFQPGTMYGQSLIADLIAEGVSCAKGYVYEPLTIAIAHPEILWNMYSKLDASGHPLFNMAESYFAASQMIGWMDVVVGDPKTSITTDSALSAVSVQSMEGTMNISPNPASNRITLNFPSIYTGELITVSIINVMGQATSPPATLQGRGGSIEVDVTNLSAGIYFVQVMNKNERWVGRFVKE